MTLSDKALVDLTQVKNFLRVDIVATLRVDAEFVGLGDGVRKIFPLTSIPVEGSLRVFVSNVRQAEITDYTISGLDISFVGAPITGAPITASYDRPAPGGTFEDFDDSLLEGMIGSATQISEHITGRAFVQRSISEEYHIYEAGVLRLRRRPVVSITSVSRIRAMSATGDAVTTAFQLGHPTAIIIKIMIDGVEQADGVDFTITDGIVTFTAAPEDKADITFRFRVPLRSGEYSEAIQIGRLYGAWTRGDEYQVIYTAGYGIDRPSTQAAVPEATMAVLVAVANWYENRLGLSSQNISGIGSMTFSGIGLPDASIKILNPLRTELV